MLLDPGIGRGGLASSCKYNTRYRARVDAGPAPLLSRPMRAGCRHPLGGGGGGPAHYSPLPNPPLLPEEPNVDIPRSSQKPPACFDMTRRKAAGRRPSSCCTCGGSRGWHMTMSTRTALLASHTSLSGLLPVVAGRYHRTAFVMHCAAGWPGSCMLCPQKSTCSTQVALGRDARGPGRGAAGQGGGGWCWCCRSCSCHAAPSQLLHPYLHRMQAPRACDGAGRGPVS